MKKILLCIMDGIGLSKEKKYNAVYNAKTPVLDYLWDHYPSATLIASGESVGLPSGQMGNSEVGHTNIGAGRLVYQSLELINSKIKDGSFYSNDEFLKVIRHVKDNNSKLHLIGLLSDGGVHSHINHLFALLDLCKKENVKNVYVHIFTDGRDVSPTSGIKYIEALEKKMKGLKLGKIASISGRYYGMDRDNRFDRVKKSYDVMTKPSLVVDVKKVWKSSQKNKITDEFIVPTATIENGFIEDNDGIIFFNFRPDRLRELASAFTNDKYECFDRCKINNLKVVSMMHVTDTVLCPYAFELPKIKNTLGEYISKKGFTQLRIAETEKYAHVTYFFDGGVDTELPLCDRILIPSPKVATYDLKPEMSAYLITDKLMNLIGKYDVIILNYANCDMVGHTGNMDAAIKAVEAVDTNLRRVYDKCIEQGVTLFVSADHGNCELMIDSNNNIVTTHTTNKVPFIVCSDDLKLKEGKISNIIPTMFDYAGIDKPVEMTENSLIEK